MCAHDETPTAGESSGPVLCTDGLDHVWTGLEIVAAGKGLAFLHTCKLCGAQWYEPSIRDSGYLDRVRGAERRRPD
ncbi:hypothetical protein FB473_003172 [Brooklawnia cerclae]|uniref:Uncharacterized protein n=1 Tax=Brooklawnia cerclae TaxID=349934 RepID=A0ABX0SNY9_9ACTN|nr:hypothetical protein [Brooklawnia cerclae]